MFIGTLSFYSRLIQGCRGHSDASNIMLDTIATNFIAVDVQLDVSPKDRVCEEKVREEKITGLFYYHRQYLV